MFNGIKAQGVWLRVWLAVLLLGCAWIGRSALEWQRDAFETDACIVHRLLSQRAVQHDAILSTLALLQLGSVAA